jgi:hypothetical protein
MTFAGGMSVEMRVERVEEPSVFALHVAAAEPEDWAGSPSP